MADRDPRMTLRHMRMLAAMAERALARAERGKDEMAKTRDVDEIVALTDAFEAAGRDLRAAVEMEADLAREERRSARESLERSRALVEEARRRRSESRRREEAPRPPPRKDLH